MKAKLQRQLAIREGILQGRTQEEVAKRLNTSISSVYRECRRMREASKQWMTDLAERDFTRIYKDSLDGLLQDLARLHDMLEEPDVKGNPELVLQIRKQITTVREAHLKHLLRAPMVWSLEVFRKKYATDTIPQPLMPSLGGISGVDV
ncbi:helix-turn-helix domain-containing protein [Candidatus Nitrosotenuis aquarius]|uniref:helix-turn-helix domain-containing protein n=1 Tax=Candidatus Nitrosotenuis aquarius TaxID=1846278 RepID=UPI000C1E37F0|nr:helix-turn-helix domain-containing protein [Candidatus Nitrosotenuis aquarius]